MKYQLLNQVNYVIIPFTDFILGDGVIECEVVYELDELLR